MRLSDIITFFTDTVFRKGAGEYRNPVARWAVRQYKLLFYTVQGLSSHGTMVRSAALTFYTLMSLVPVVALVFAVVKGFGLAEGLEQNLYEVLPQSPEVIDYVVGFAQKALARTQGGWVALVGVLTLFWAVIKVFGSIEDAFNNIWEVRSTRSAARKYGDYIAVVVVAPILWVISSSMGNYAAEILGVAGSPALEVLSRAGSLVVAWVMFTFIYVVLPSTKVRLTAALTAGVVAGTAFVLFQWGYVYLQRWMTSYNAIYGSFAALPLFLLWMQISWEILLLGGELSFAYQNVARFDEERESLLVSYDCRRKLMVGVMLLGGNFKMNSQSMNIRRIIISGTQHQFIGRCNRWPFAEFYIKKRFGMFDRTLEHPINHTQSKHILAPQHRFLVKPGFSQGFDRQFRYPHRDNIIIRQRTVFQRIFGISGTLDMLIGKSIGIYNNRPGFLCPSQIGL